MTRRKFLVTGAAGFIGYFTAKALLERGDEVVGLDNLNDYYDVSLKKARLDNQKQLRFQSRRSGLNISENLYNKLALFHERF
jgi:UDP-glucuronate 4-epimerase